MHLLLDFRLVPFTTKPAGFCSGPRLVLRLQHFLRNVAPLQMTHVHVVVGPAVGPVVVVPVVVQVVVVSVVVVRVVVPVVVVLVFVVLAFLRSCASALLRFCASAFLRFYVSALLRFCVSALLRFCPNGVGGVKSVFVCVAALLNWAGGVRTHLQQHPVLTVCSASPLLLFQFWACGWALGTRHKWVKDICVFALPLVFPSGRFPLDQPFLW